MHLSAKDSSIFIAGHRGLVGGAVHRLLESQGFSNLITRTRKELDLTDQQAVTDFFGDEKPEFVVLAAARVGGILANDRYPADFLLDNLKIQSNVIDAAFQTGVKRLIFLGSTCIYPKLAPQPLREESLLTGPLEPTNQWYAIAKIAGVKLCEALRKQHGVDFVSLMPTNLYGPGDNFDLETSHVLPALIRKFDDARGSNASVTLWGSGTPKREFLHVEDLAEAVLHVMETPESELYAAASDGLMNVGTGDDISIIELAGLVRNVVGADNAIEWDRSKPDGTPRKLVSAERLFSLGWHPNIELRQGLESTYEWYLKNRGRK